MGVVELSKGSTPGLHLVPVLIVGVLAAAIVLGITLKTPSAFDFSGSSAEDAFNRFAEDIERECQSLGNTQEVQALGTYDFTGIEQIKLTETSIEAAGKQFEGSREIDCQRLRFCGKNRKNCGKQVLEVGKEVRLEFYKPDTKEIDVFPSAVGLQGCWLEVYKDKGADSSPKHRFTSDQPKLGELRDYEEACVKDYGQGHWNDCISSLKLASGCKVTVFQDKDYGDPQKTFTKSQKRLGEVEGPCNGNKENWNDCISSFRLEKDPCAAVTCPQNHVCRNGACRPP